MKTSGQSASTVVAALFFCGASLAQTNVDGWIHGLAPPGATLQIVGLESGARTEVRADRDGRFRASQLAAGRYRVTHANAEETVEVRVGEGAFLRFEAGDESVPVIIVTATLAPIDPLETETALNLDIERFEALPAPRTLTAVALLAPDTTLGDNGLRDSVTGNPLPSFGGSTVAENQYYLNGFNLSDVRNRLAPANVPFEFFEQFQVKSGGLSPEFGRMSGGVINAVSRRGTNDWESGTAYYFEPELLRAHKPDIRAPGTTAPLYLNSRDRLQRHNLAMWGGGPLVRDTLFAFALVNYARVEERVILRRNRYASDFAKRGDRVLNEYEEPYLALKLDALLGDASRLEYTGFTDRTDVSQDARQREEGGEAHILRFSTQMRSDLHASVLAGEARRRRNFLSAEPDCPFIEDTRENPVTGCHVDDLLGNLDRRRGYRLDLEWDLGAVANSGSHRLRVGLDREENRSRAHTALAGGAAYRLQTRRAGEQIVGVLGGPVAPEDGDYFEKEVSFGDGTVEETLQGYYFENAWQPHARVVLDLGLRYDRFVSRNRDQPVFLDVDSGIAPRLGAAWDVSGDGRTKLYANYGRYALWQGPIQSLFYQTGAVGRVEYYRLTGISEDRTRTPQGELLGTIRFADGSVRDRSEFVDPDLRPTRLDEWILGYQTALPEKWFGEHAVFGLRLIRRKIAQVLEDIQLDPALNVLFDDAPGAVLRDCDGEMHFACGFDYPYITNPGRRDPVVFLDTDGDGVRERLVVPNTLLGIRPGRRRYLGVELSFERELMRRGFVQASYTWSHAYGNHEGPVLSTNEQANPSSTIEFDFAGAQDHAHGDLPNDRRHKFKLFGSYEPVPQWQLGFNFLLQSGRPLSALGIHPTDPFTQTTGAAAYYRRGAPSARGSAGNTPSLWQLDLGLRYRPSWLPRLTLGADVFNVANQDRATEQVERAELTRDAADPSRNTPNPNFALPSDFQPPRSVRLQLEYRFR